MDIKEIQELIKFVAKSGATEVDLEIDNVKISIKSPPKKRRGEASEDAVKIVHQAHSHPVVVPQNETNTQPIAQNIAETISKSKSFDDLVERFWSGDLKKTRIAYESTLDRVDKFTNKEGAKKFVKG